MIAFHFSGFENSKAGGSSQYQTESELLLFCDFSGTCIGSDTATDF